MNTLRHWWHDSTQRRETPDWLKQGKKLLNWLNRPLEPCIWQNKNKTGHRGWNIYDPTTQRSHHFHSEQEARIWLDEQYYRHE